MFIKITRTTHKGECKETILNKDLIVSVKEKTLEPIELYDSEGNVVETKEQPKTFKVIMRGGEYYNLNEDQYNDLVKELLK
jgi:hypothetical protein